MDDIKPIDSTGQLWTIPSLTWGTIKKVNKVLRDNAAELQLPLAEDRKPLTDLHHPAVQQWFYSWAPAVIVVGAVVLSDQAAALQLDEDGFAKRWGGDAGDRLKAAIWREWLLYLPQPAREQSTEIAREISTRRAMQSKVAVGLIDLMETETDTVVGSAIQQMRRKLELVAEPHTLTKTACGTPESSVSTLANGATASSGPCTSPGKTPRGRRPLGQSPTSVAPG